MITNAAMKNKSLWAYKKKDKATTGTTRLSECCLLATTTAVKKL